MDKALLRPGRIDIKINFTKCTNKMAHDIIEYFYDKKMEEQIKIKDDAFSPAEILEICFNNENNILFPKVSFY